MGALSLTGQPAKREPFKPLLKKISHVPYGDVKKLARAVNKKTAMVILEPIMGEAGVIVPDDNYLKSAREICDKHGALLVLDAVQTGMGRTGTWFGYEDSGITPDVITIAKGLGGGLPIGAMIALGRAAELITPGSHGSTFGGNPISCAAGNATIDEIESKKYMKTNRQFGLQIMSALRQIPGISDVRGKGLLIGFDFSKPIAKKIASELQNRGVLVNAASETTIRIAPAFVITQKNVDEFLRACREVVANHG
jgi:acetylornithine aminotransferase